MNTSKNKKNNKCKTRNLIIFDKTLLANLFLLAKKSCNKFIGQLLYLVQAKHFFFK